MPLRGLEDISVSVLGWSKDGKVALNVLYPNPLDGYDASYLLVNLIDDSTILQLDVTHTSKKTAFDTLNKKWFSLFQKHMQKHLIILSNNDKPLNATFNINNANYQLIMSANHLILKRDNQQKIIMKDISTDSKIVHTYLSSQEARIAIILKEKNNIKIVGSNLLVGFK